MTVSLRKIKPRGTFWVCVDCMFTHANGEEERDSATRPWALWEDSPEDVTMGTLDHDCDEDTRESGECGCDTIEFTWADCDGCGSTLGGSRYAFTWWAQ